MAYMEIDKQNFVNYCFGLSDMNQFTPYDRMLLIQKNSLILNKISFSGIFFDNGWKEWMQVLGKYLKSKENTRYSQRIF